MEYNTFTPSPDVQNETIYLNTQISMLRSIRADLEARNNRLFSLIKEVRSLFIASQVQDENVLKAVNLLSKEINK